MNGVRLHNGHIRHEADVDSRVRLELLRRLEEQPGLSIQELSDSFALSRGSIRHHLNILTRQGQVVGYRQGNQRLHFHTQLPLVRRKSVFLLRIGSIRSFVGGTLDSPHFHPSQLAQAVGLSTRSVRRALRILEKAGLVVQRRVPGSRGLIEISFNPELRIVWRLYIQDAGPAQVKPLVNHPMWFLGASLLLRKFAAVHSAS